MSDVEARRVRVVISAETSNYIRGVNSSANATEAAMARNRAATGKFRAEVDRTGLSIDNLNKKTVRTTRTLDSYSGRVGAIADALTLLGPAAVPLTAAAIPAVTGLASQLGVAGLAAGTLALAASGVGDAWKSLGDGDLDKAQQALDKLSPWTRAVVMELHEMRPALRGVQHAAAEGVFSGMLDEIDDLEAALPRIRRFVGTYGSAAGDALSQIVGDATSGRWSKFVDFLEAEAQPSLASTTSAALDLTHGLSELWMAFDPLNDDFLAGMTSSMSKFDSWASGLSDTQGFRDFLSYVDEMGPEAVETLAALGNAAVDLTGAIAPLGGPVLDILEGVADGISTIARSELGTPLVAAYAGWRLLARGAQAYGAVTQSSAVMSTRTLIADLRTMGNAGVVAWARTSEQQAAATAAAGRTKATLAGFGKTAATVGGLAIAMSGVAEETGMANTASLALMGTMAGPWGAAVGAATGAMMDLAAANNDAQEAIQSTKEALAQAFAADAGTADVAAVEAQYEAAVRRVDELAEAIQNDPMAGAREMFGDLLPGISDYEDEYNKVIALKERLHELRIRESGATAGAAALSAYRDSIEAETQAIHDNIDAMREKRSLALAGMDAELGYQSAILDARDSLEENGRTLNKHTRAGIANREALYGLAAAWNSQNEAAKAAPGAHRAAIRTFVDMAERMGMGRRTARELAAEIFEIPTNRSVTVDAQTAAAEANVEAIQRLVNRYGMTRAEAIALLKDAASGKIRDVQQLANRFGVTRAQAQALLNDLASGKLNGLLGLLRAVDGKTAHTTTTHEIITQYRVVRNPMDALPNRTSSAAGNIYASVRTYAGGGTRDPYDRANAHPPHIARAGTYRLFAEDETGGEAYIPFANDWRRPRAIAIWEETGRRLGLEFQRYAEGGTTKKDRFTRSEYRDARRNFDLTRDMGWAEARKELREFAREVKRAGGSVGKNFDRLSNRIKSVSTRLEKRNARLDAWTARRDDARGRAASSFDNDAFGGTLDDLRIQLQADRNDSRRMADLTKQLRRKGIDKNFLAEIAASGNIGLAEQLSGLSRQKLRDYEKLFGSRNFQQTQLGNQAAAGYKTVIQNNQAAVRLLVRKLERLESAVERGARRGVSDNKKKSTAKGKGK